MSHTLCGYAWGDVGGALLKAIATGDMNRSQRWAAELVCSETGLGRLEALLFHAWALYVGPAAAPGWPAAWYKNLQHIRVIWVKCGGDLRTVRNTPSVRQAVAESVAWLVLAQKRPLPPLPKPEDCWREAEAVRTRIRNGGGAGEQVSVKRIWVSGQDGVDLKTIGNEFEATLRGNQTSRMLFWIVWFLTLDTQKEVPPVKERCPPEIKGKQRKSVLWFLSALIKDLMEESRVVSAEELKLTFELFVHTWAKLGVKGRRDILASLALFTQERAQKGLLIPPTPPVPQPGIREAMTKIDTIYVEIAQEAKRFIAETPQITELTREAAEAKAAAAALAAAKKKLSSNEKLDIAYSFLGLTG